MLHGDPGAYCTLYFTVLYCAVLYGVQVRILCGLGEGVTAPAMFAMLARWSAPQERSRWPLIQTDKSCKRSIAFHIHGEGPYQGLLLVESAK